MDEAYLTLLFNNLKSRGIRIDQGLTKEEIKQIQERYSIIFPSDLAQVFSNNFPFSDGFPDWKNGSEVEIRKWLNEPLQGICFDIEHNNFWLSSWGERPKRLHESFEVASFFFSKAPKLIPVYKHRYIPSEPNEVGNPVYSVWQTDIIYYGYDLSDYFYREFGVPLLNPRISEPKKIKFWEEILS